VFKIGDEIVINKNNLDFANVKIGDILKIVFINKTEIHAKQKLSKFNLLWVFNIDCFKNGDISLLKNQKSNILNNVRDCVNKLNSDMVNHPFHYKGNKFEVIDVINDFDLNFNVGNIIKYTLRAGKKDDAVQDLEKAKQYIEFEIKRLNNA
jgi:signal peptidase I